MNTALASPGDPPAVPSDSSRELDDEEEANVKKRVIHVEFQDINPSAAPPATNDDMVDATVISLNNYTDNVDTTAASLEAGEPVYDCGWGIGKTVWYEFTPSTTRYYLVDTIGSDFDTVLHILKQSDLSVVACDDDSGEYGTSRVMFEATAGTTYLISVGGFGGSSGSMALNFNRQGNFVTCEDVDVAEAECEALLALYAATGGPSWYDSSGWLVIDQVCNWYGITCAVGSVELINLDDNNLLGVPTADLTSLIALVEFDISDNSGVTGDISALMGNLPSNVKEVVLDDNQMTGSIETCFSGFPDLITLDFDYNLFSGDLALFVGTLPASIGFIDLEGTNITGEIPDLTSFGALDFFDVSKTSVGGDLGTAIGNLPTSLYSLYLDETALTGTLSSSISLLTILETIDLKNNPGLMGEIPIDITGLSPWYFDFSNTYLCEPGDTSYTIWAAGLPEYYPGICGYAPVDLVIEDITFSPIVPLPGEAFDAAIHVRNIGGADLSTSVWVEYYDETVTPPTACYDYGSAGVLLPSLAPGFSIELIFNVPSGKPLGSYNIYAYADTECDELEGDDTNNGFGPVSLKVSTSFFESYFEAGTFDEWSRFNDGNGFLYPCTSGALHGTWGACVERGSNDKRKQLIDETPVNQTVFNVQFGFDVNSLSMGVGERFRFMQVKMGPERPFFIVMKYQGGQYQIQLNALLDDLTKVKTGWYLLSDAPHVIEVGWEAASGPAADNGSITLYIDDLSMEVLSGLDNDTIYVDSYKTGFTSKLVGKTISGIFYLDDIITSRSGYIGLP